MVELIIVMAIISVMAAFGVPSFTKAMSRARARDAQNNLTIIHASQALYRANLASNLRGANLGALNAALSLNLVSTGGTTYACNDGIAPASPTTCVATAAGGAAVFQTTLTLATGAVVCAGTDCP